jgi:hypothetical protein
MGLDHFITDRHGVTYRVESDMGIGWTLYVWHGDMAVGELLCSFARPTLNLGNLQIYHNVRVPETWFALRFREFRHYPAPVIDYRKRGLGTALLELIEALARSEGFTRLEGWISGVDYKPNPGLPDWYRARGYTVTMEPGEEVAVKVATIHKSL